MTKLGMTFLGGTLIPSARTGEPVHWLEYERLGEPPPLAPEGAPTVRS